MFRVLYEQMVYYGNFSFLILAVALLTLLATVIVGVITIRLMIRKGKGD
jgi:uncharacterized membrane-anchored protein YhcB (DUF1043 family)